MKVKPIRYWFVINAIFTIVSVFTIAIIFIINVDKVKLEAEKTFSARAAITTKSFSLYETQVEVLNGLFKNGYESYMPAEPSDFIYYNKYRLWAYSPSGSTLVGSLTTKTDPLLMPAEAMSEVAATQEMQSQLYASTKPELKVFESFYLSKNKFFFAYPYRPVKRSRFSDSLYLRRNWSSSLARLNRSGGVIVTEPFMNENGKWLVSFSKPVYHDSQIKGVVGINIRVSALDEYTSIGHAIGKTMLIIGNVRSSTTNELFKPGDLVQDLHQDRVKTGWRKDENGYWLSKKITSGDVWLVHNMPYESVYKYAAYETIPAALLVLLLSAVAVLAQKLHKALVSVTALTIIDPLTQLLNRRGLAQRFSLVANEQSRSQDTDLFIFIFDIDHFKMINDTYGHPAGDLVLSTMGKSIKENSRPKDISCRWGGEEFLVILNVNKNNHPPVSDIAERLRINIQKEISKCGCGDITISGGLTKINDLESFEVAVARADSLLYNAKKTGRARIISG